MASYVTGTATNAASRLRPTAHPLDLPLVDLGVGPERKSAFLDRGGKRAGVDQRVYLSLLQPDALLHIRQPKKMDHWNFLGQKFSPTLADVAEQT
jgi:hypothetical protein